MLNLQLLESIQELIKPYPNGGYDVGEGQLYCPSCGDFRRMTVKGLYNSWTARRESISGKTIGYELSSPPWLFVYTCVQCKSTFTALVYDGGEGPTLVVLPSTKGGLTTPHTPTGVAYYLDQAYKAQLTGANSAAMAMYRGALEHLLFEQGYTEGMLAAKLKKLDADIKGGSAPKWAVELETEFLNVMKDLGNGAIHPNDGDITKQTTLDDELIEAVKATFHQLLFLVYELPHQKQQRLDLLKSKANILKR